MKFVLDKINHSAIVWLCVSGSPLDFSVFLGS